MRYSDDSWIPESLRSIDLIQFSTLSLPPQSLALLPLLLHPYSLWMFTASTLTLTFSFLFDVPFPHGTEEKENLMAHSWKNSTPKSRFLRSSSLASHSKSLQFGSDLYRMFVWHYVRLGLITNICNDCSVPKPAWEGTLPWWAPEKIIINIGGSGLGMGRKHRWTKELG